MRRSELARLADVNAETLRFYEKAGLLPAPSRTAGNYRDYSDRDLSIVRFIKSMRAVGFELEIVRAVLDGLRGEPSVDRSELLSQLHQKAELLKNMEELLAALKDDRLWASKLIEAVGQPKAPITDAD